MIRVLKANFLAHNTLFKKKKNSFHKAWPRLLNDRLLRINSSKFMAVYHCNRLQVERDYSQGLVQQAPLTGLTNVMVQVQALFLSVDI